MTTAARTTADRIRGTNLFHRSEAQNKEYTGFCECIPADLDNPPSGTLAMVRVSNQLGMYWLQEGSKNIDTLKSFIRNEPDGNGSIPGTDGLVTVFTVPVPTLVG